MMIVGIDTGGTFTDFVLWRNDALTVHKVLSTPAQPEQAILKGLRELDVVMEDLRIIHGSTVATNAALEGKGVKTLYISNRGFADVLTIGRQNRHELYNLQPLPEPPPVPPELCFETGGRLSATGAVVEDLTEQDLQQLSEAIARLKPDAVAINLLFSYLDNAFEKRLAAQVPANIFRSLSSEVLPEIKEYERGMATWLNAWLGPLVKDYLSRLLKATRGAAISVMQSSGDTIKADQAGDQAVRMLLSGPAGGLVAARRMAVNIGIQRILTFDMGGTSTDVALIEGDIQLTNEGRVGHYPVAVPMVDMHTIGAGGGSIAWLDAGGMLQVGPESAGASPGPACYGLGGQYPTVTDANVFLGRIPEQALLAGGMSIDVSAARRVITELAKKMQVPESVAAQGIVDVANQHMVSALKMISLQRGKDARDFTLLSFGGAGGLHVCALAEALGMSSAMVPAFGGVLSAMGLLVAEPGRQYSHTYIALLDALSNVQIDTLINGMAEQGRQALLEEGQVEEQIRYKASLDLRYAGQSYSLNLPWSDIDAAIVDFHRLHKQRYGHNMKLSVELVNVRLAVAGSGVSTSLKTASIDADNADAIEAHKTETPVFYCREALPYDQEFHGPLIITESVATTWVADGWCVFRDHENNLMLERKR